MVKLSRVGVGYQEIKEELENVLKNNNVISKTYPGDAFNFFLELSAGLATMLGYKIDFNFRNSFIPTLHSRGAAYALASTLGYIPRRRQPATVRVRFEGNVSVPAETLFTIDGRTWINLQGFTLSSGVPVEVDLIQARPVREEFSGNGRPFQSFVLSYGPEVVNDSIYVSVDSQAWTRADSFLDELSTKRIYLERYYYNGKLIIIFGDGSYGETPSSGSRIVVSYRITDGEEANMIPTGQEVSHSLPLSSGQFLNGITITSSSGGAEEDTVEDIKFIAPRLFAAAGRAVRRSDYVAHLLKNSQIGSAGVIGEYEMTKEAGFSSHRFMNRVRASFVKKNIFYSEVSLNTYNTTVYNISIGDVPIYRGSYVAKEQAANGEEFVDVEGYVIPTLEPPSGFSGGAVIGGDQQAIKAFDNDFSEFWDTGVVPEDNTVIYTGYTFSSPRKIVAVRFKVSSAGRQMAVTVPARVIVFATNVDNPGAPVLEDSGSSPWVYLSSHVVRRMSRSHVSEWYPTLAGQSYKTYAIVFHGRRSVGGTLKFDFIQGVAEGDVGTINYETGAVTVRFTRNPISGSSLVSSYCYGDFTYSQGFQVCRSLDSVKGVQVELVYTPVRIVRVPLRMTIHYDTFFKLLGIQRSVEAAVKNFFAIGPRSMGKKFFRAELARVVMSVDGVSYVEIIDPHEDIELAFNEVVYAHPIAIEWIPMGRR